MDAGLSIAASGIAAATTEIDITSENIANAQTPGYVTEVAQLAEQPGGGTEGVGGGVGVTSVAQLNDTLLNANNIQAQGALSNLSSLQQVLTGIEDVFPLGQAAGSASTPTSGSSNSSIAGQLANFWSSWDGITQDPSAAAPRTEVVDLAQGLVTSLNEASTQLSQLASNTSSQLATSISQVNGLLGQAAALNQSIVATKGAGASTNQLEDEMNTITSQLASTAGVSVQTEQNGTALISIGGVAVVQGDTASTLALTTNETATSITTSNGNVTVPVSSGSIAGLLSGLNVSIPNYVTSLNTVANDLATTVNTQLASGVTATGTSGSTLPLFTANDGTTTPESVTAGTISVNPNLVSDPANIAAATPTPSDPGAEANDGSNAATMAELGTVATGPDAAYQQLIENIGSETQSVNSQVTSQTSVANEAQQALSSATGVNTNTELTNLIQFQNSYQASAKLVSVIDATIQSLLEAI